MQVTVFAPAMEGLLDCDYGPHVYAGKLTYEQVCHVAAELGNVGKGGYARYAVSGNQDEGYFVSYANDSDDEATECSDYGGEQFDEDVRGHLTFDVEFRELQTAK